MATQTASTDRIHIYSQLSAYDWSSDPEFQGGLSAILGSAQSPSQVANLTLRAQCYYFARKTSTKIDFADYQSWLQEQQQHQQQQINPQTNDYEALTLATELSDPAQVAAHLSTDAELSTQPSSTTTIEVAQPAQQSPHGSAPTPSSFAEICELIAAGKPIPGIKEIPDTVLEGQGTRPAATRRKKPWESA